MYIELWLTKIKIERGFREQGIQLNKLKTEKKPLSK